MLRCEREVTILLRQNQAQKSHGAGQQRNDDDGVQHSELALMPPVGRDDRGSNKTAPASVCFIDNGFHAFY